MKDYSKYIEIANSKPQLKSKIMSATEAIAKKEIDDLLIGEMICLPQDYIEEFREDMFSRTKRKAHYMSGFNPTVVVRGFMDYSIYNIKDLFHNKEQIAFKSNDLLNNLFLMLKNNIVTPDYKPAVDMDFSKIEEYIKTRFLSEENKEIRNKIIQKFFDNNEFTNEEKIALNKTHNIEDYIKIMINKEYDKSEEYQVTVRFEGFTDYICFDSEEEYEKIMEIMKTANKIDNF